MNEDSVLGGNIMSEMEVLMAINIDIWEDGGTQGFKTCYWLMKGWNASKLDIES
jgi:hypothetical protein